MLHPCCAVSRLDKRPTALSINSRTGGTLASRGNSTSSKLQGLEVLSPWDSLRSSTHEGSTKNKGDVIAKSYALQAITYRHTYKNQNFFFLVHEWRGFARDPSQSSRLLRDFFTWLSMCEGGTRNGLPIVFLEESRKSTSSVLPSRLLSDLLSEEEASGALKNKLIAR